MDSFSKVKSMLTRWYHSTSARYAKTMVAYTIYAPYCVVQSVHDVRVFDGNKLQFVIYRMVESDKVEVFWGRGKDKYQHVITEWLKRVNK